VPRSFERFGLSSASVFRALRSFARFGLFRLLRSFEHFSSASAFRVILRACCRQLVDECIQSCPIDTRRSPPGPARPGPARPLALFAMEWKTGWGVRARAAGPGQAGAIVVGSISGVGAALPPPLAVAGHRRTSREADPRGGGAHSFTH
jgi:hypothetical protein